MTPLEPSLHRAVYIALPVSCLALSWIKSLAITLNLYVEGFLSLLYAASVRTFAGLELPMARLNLKNGREGKIERRRLSLSQLSINIID